MQIMIRPSLWTFPIVVCLFALCTQGCGGNAGGSGDARGADASVDGSQEKPRGDALAGDDVVAPNDVVAPKDVVAPNDDGAVDVSAPVEDASVVSDGAMDVTMGGPDVGPGTDAGVDSVGCGTGQHICAGSTTCQPIDSVTACGAACAICAVPAGGVAICAAGVCDFSCGALKKCATANLCIPATGCCEPSDCPPQNGKVGSCDTSSHACQYACAAGTVACGAACIAVGQCCADSDCPGACQKCGASHTCEAAVNQADPNGRCSGTCDAAGACKGQQGQACTSATASGCLSGLPCVDGVCCNQACTGACMACDVAGARGTCTAVASGSPHGGRTCAAPVGGTASCLAGSCVTSCGAQKECVAALVCIAPAGCCDASECAPQPTKVASCDATTHSCSYACAADAKLCNGACIPMTSDCLSLYLMMSVSAGSQLIRFSSSAPGTLTASTLVTGTPTGVRIIGMAFRPTTGVLYGVGADSQLYTINPTTAVATAVGAPLSPILEPTPSQYVGFTFAPDGNTIRIWNATGQNLRVNPATGATTVDTRLPQGFGTGIAPRAIAYTDSPATLYALDALNDTVSMSSDASAGTVAQVAPLGFDMEAAGFDIQDHTNVGFAATMVNGVLGTVTLYRIDLPSGVLTLVGTVNSPAGLVKALAIAP